MAQQYEAFRDCVEASQDAALLLAEHERCRALQHKRRWRLAQGEVRNLEQEVERVQRALTASEEGARIAREECDRRTSEVQHLLQELGSCRRELELHECRRTELEFERAKLEASVVNMVGALATHTTTLPPPAQREVVVSASSRQQEFEARAATEAAIVEVKSARSRARVAELAAAERELALTSCSEARDAAEASANAALCLGRTDAKARYVERRGWAAWVAVCQAAESYRLSQVSTLSAQISVQTAQTAQHKYASAIELDEQKEASTCLIEELRKEMKSMRTRNCIEIANCHDRCQAAEAAGRSSINEMMRLNDTWNRAAANMFRFKLPGLAGHDSCALHKRINSLEARLTRAQHAISAVTRVAVRAKADYVALATRLSESKSAAIRASESRDRLAKDLVDTRNSLEKARRQSDAATAAAVASDARNFQLAKSYATLLDRYQRAVVAKRRDTERLVSVLSADSPATTTFSSNRSPPITPPSGTIVRSRYSPLQDDDAASEQDVVAKSLAATAQSLRRSQAILGSPYLAPFSNQRPASSSLLSGS